MENDIWRHYQQRNPGEVQVLGPDLYNGTHAQLSQFRDRTGATYPLLLDGGLGSGNENLYMPYVQFDNYVVINKQGVIRYHAYDLWPHGNRYHLDEIRATVDSLVGGPVGVAEGAPRAHRLDAMPNPFRGATTVEFANPAAVSAPARVTVHDLAGRRVASLWDGPAAPGPTRVAWGGRDARGVAVPPGVYLVRSEVGGVTRSRRIVRLAP